MTVPAVKYSVLNGRLGVRAPTGVEIHAYVGPCSSGAYNTPTRHVRVDDVVSTYGGGPATELAIGAIESFGADVLMVRTETSVAASFDTIDTAGVTGTSVVTLDGGADCDDDYQAVIKVVVGGTVGVAGITYQWSLDGGYSFSPVTALGTANSITIPGSGGIEFSLAAGTLVAGDTWSIVSHAPCWNVSDLTKALATVKASSVDVRAIWIAGPVDATAAAALSTFLNGVQNTTGKAMHVYCSVRMPDAGESDATYQASVSAAFANFADFRVKIGAAACRRISARPGRTFTYRRPVVFAYAGLPAALPLSVDMSQVVDATPNALPGVSIYDSNGNRIEHDEMVQPGLDDARFIALRSWIGRAGTFVNNPRTMEQAGGDFHLDQFVRILCTYLNIARGSLVQFVSRALELNTTTNGANVAGAPTEDECQRIDATVLAALQNALAGQVTSVQFRVNRDDQILVTQTLHATGGIVFKGYPKLIEFTVSAINPAS